jgi:hypothetical protein
MSQIFTPGAGLLYMKVGVHAQETLADIIKRKAKEIDDAGFAMWGYGGNTCHPSTMVQPFAEQAAQKGAPIYLCMQEMESNHYADPIRANEYSTDGRNWKEIPASINVLGSRFALMIQDLHEDEFKFHLDQTRVPVGPSTGRLGSDYIKGRVDKACLEVLDAPRLSNEAERKEISINLVAKLLPPYAVYLRR